ncbi:hypothetical protein VQ056_12440 [Paenibacillus sp. JTLBN-2024]
MRFHIAVGAAYQSDIHNGFAQKLIPPFDFIRHGTARIGLAEHLKKQQKPHNNKDSKAHLSKSYAKEMFENHLKPLQME